jgi:predicted 3-demethylubiquinone-9 3-methyltransferase (glyoxalase superfamily)
MRLRQKITTFLWFDDNAEEAVNFYVSIFGNSKIVNTMRYGDAGPGPTGQVMSVTFQLAGQEFIALNGGPHFRFTEAISLFVDCETQEEVDGLHAKLTAGGGAGGPCGWLRDRFGLSWQIVPFQLGEMLRDKDARKAGNVMHAMMQMTKLDIERLQDAYDRA